MSSKIYKNIGITFWFLALIFALLPSWPYLYYRLSPQASSDLATTIANTTTSPSTIYDLPSITPSLSPSPSIAYNPPSTKPSLPLPPLNPSLPTQNGLLIDKIGVKGEIHEGEDWEKILKTGIWRVPNFATPSTIHDLPSTKPLPIILAAHRWGYLEWSASFRKLNSFYNLPKLVEGDKIELIWEQRKYKYVVKAVSTGTEITDYSHDLILYTCQLWNSPVRFFVYASRTN